VEYLQWSADLGNASGEITFANALEKGIGVEKDPILAVEYYTRSVDQGNSVGRSNLELCLANGSGCVADPKEGALLLMRAANQGFPAAQYNCGYFLEQRRDAKESAEAARYCKLAMKGGYAGAKPAYRRCRQSQ
jgi:TPR repeat protein